MKKTGVLLLTLMILISAFGFTQDAGDIDFEAFDSAFYTFGETVGPALPLAANIGLNWSDAYIGQILGVPPRFGAGITLGVVFLPVEQFTKVLDVLQQEELLGALPKFGELGLPFPIYTLEGRIGGFMLDFDLGLKAGFIPATEAADEISGKYDLDYTMLGADIRVPIIKQNIALPNLSIGAGFTYLRGGVGLAPETNLTFSIEDASVEIGNPRLGFAWETTVFDIKTQISKSLLLFTPYLGGGVSFHKSSAGGSLTGDVTVSGNYEGETFVLAEGSEKVEGMVPAEGTNIRIYGGVSLNLLLLKLDVQGLYDLSSETPGASINARLQM